MGITWEKMYGEARESPDASAFDLLSWRFNHLPEARRSRNQRADALAEQVAEGHADVRADEVLPGDVIRTAGNVWVVQDARIGSGGVCFLSTLGGHMQACDRTHRIQLLSSPRRVQSAHGSPATLRRRAPAPRRRVAA